MGSFRKFKPPAPRLLCTFCLSPSISTQLDGHFPGQNPLDFLRNGTVKPYFIDTYDAQPKTTLRTCSTKASCQNVLGVVYS